MEAESDILGTACFAWFSFSLDFQIFHPTTCWRHAGRCPHASSGAVVRTHFEHTSPSSRDPRFTRFSRRFVFLILRAASRTPSKNDSSFNQLQASQYPLDL